MFIYPKQHIGLPLYPSACPLLNNSMHASRPLSKLCKGVNKLLQVCIPNENIGPLDILIFLIKRLGCFPNANIAHIIFADYSSDHGISTEKFVKSEVTEVVSYISVLYMTT